LPVPWRRRINPYINGISKLIYKLFIINLGRRQIIINRRKK